MIRLVLSVSAWWLLSRWIDAPHHGLVLGAVPSDIIAGVLVVVAWPVVAGLGEMAGLRRRSPAAPPPPGGAVEERRVALGPTAFSTGVWGWLIARQLRGGR